MGREMESVVPGECVSGDTGVQTQVDTEMGHSGDTGRCVPVLPRLLRLCLCCHHTVRHRWSQGYHYTILTTVSTHFVILIRLHDECWEFRLPMFELIKR